MVNYINNGISFLTETLINVTVYSVQYLGWVTAVVAAILALTAIVFTQFNERVVQKISDLSYEIKKEKHSTPPNYVQIIDHIDRILFLSKNIGIYKSNLKLFKYVSYFIVFIWWISVFGYIANDEHQSLGNTIVIILSTVLLTIPFIGLPIIMQRFNSNSQNYERFANDKISLNELELFFAELEMKNLDVVKDILAPTIEIEKNGPLEIKFRKKLPITDYYMVILIKEIDMKLVVRYINDSSYRETSLLVGEEKDNFDTLFNELLRLNQRDFYMFVFSEDKVQGYKGQIECCDGKIAMNSYIKCKDSLDQTFKAKCSEMNFINKEGTIKYKLTERAD